MIGGNTVTPVTREKFAYTKDEKNIFNYFSPIREKEKIVLPCYRIQ